MMRKLVIFSVLMVLVLSLSASAQLRFRDVPDNHWAADAVYDLVKLGVTQGYPDGTFRGKKQITRYETAAFLSKLAKAIKGTPAAGGLSESEVKSIVREELAGVKMKKLGAAVSGVAYFSWQRGMQNYGSVNDFDIERVYVNIKNKLSGNASSRVTFDVGRNKDSGGNTDNVLGSYLKYAYVDLNDVAPDTPADGAIRIGLLPTYWTGYVDGILGIRYVSKCLTDLNGVLKSADFGVGTVGTLNFEGLPAIAFHGSVVNGAGYKSAETNSGKTIGLRLNSEILPGLTVAGGGQVADIDSSGTGSKLANALVAYKVDILKAYVEYLYGAGQSGYSLGGIVEVVPGINVFGRLDNYNPSRAASNDESDRILAGASYDWGKNVKIAADYVSTQYGSAASANAGQTVSLVEVRTQVKF
jgi:hypothetical protein